MRRQRQSERCEGNGKANDAKVTAKRTMRRQRQSELCEGNGNGQANDAMGISIRTNIKTNELAKALGKSSLKEKARRYSHINTKIQLLTN
ncbi:hypothetical protein POVWA2_056990 [Plasmodium ovale wallikeri]|uniref:Uncharacterized protein n=1 Tax=Plasmodium ovale wallikeri TaxID=864142 RepID=A0A1A8ZX32_PLAOA|nr:hypothetical protein POVWA1_057640 [Plasmodium ovale wallikeri]SBT48898.1 hypothetical protein POVWA2_056990 [Plasmodium ovale wallikeri]